MSEQPVEAVAVETPAAAESEEIAELETLHNPSNLLRMVTFAKVLSWIILVVSLLAYGSQLYSIYAQVQEIIASGMAFSDLMKDASFWSAVGSPVSNFLLGFFYFVVLQGLAEGLNILADIFDSTL